MHRSSRQFTRCAALPATVRGSAPRQHPPESPQNVGIADPVHTTGTTAGGLAEAPSGPVVGVLWHRGPIPLGGSHLCHEQPKAMLPAPRCTPLRVLLLRVAAGLTPQCATNERSRRAYRLNRCAPRPRFCTGVYLDGGWAGSTTRPPGAHSEAPDSHGARCRGS